MEVDKKKAFKTLNPRRIWIPVLFGLGIVTYMFYRDPNLNAGNLSMLFTADKAPIFLALVALMSRDIGYVYRIRLLTNKELSWTSSLYVIFLWEFASAVTPSVVGGAAVAVFILMKERLSLGRSLAYVMLTAIFDNLFFVIAAPIALILAGKNIFPAVENMHAAIGDSLVSIFFVSYGMIAIYTLIMGYAIFFRPRGFKWVLLKITSVRFLRKWRQKANEHGDEIIIAAEELKGNPASHWLKISLSTVVIWSARYLMVNCLIEAYTDINVLQHFLVFGKHIILWIIMLFSPTPGSSGTAEYFFPIFFREFLGPNSIIITIPWRILTYYFYLIIGIIILPKWIKRVFFKGKEQKN